MNEISSSKDRLSGEGSNPRSEYTRRLGYWNDASAVAARLERQISNSRLVVFLAGAITGWFVVIQKTLAPGWLALPTVLFLSLVFFHQRVILRRRRAERAIAHYQRGMARLEDRWAGTGESGAAFAPENHSYAGDLDIFGAGSLFELLCTARTRAGEKILAEWLCNPAPMEEVRERQEAVAELRLRIDLREDLGILGTDVRSGVHPDALTSWGSATPVLTSRWTRWIAGLLALSTFSLFIAGFWIGWKQFLALLLLEGLFALYHRYRVQGAIQGVERAGADLALLSGILERFEKEKFESPRLKDLRISLDTAGIPPSRRIRRLGRLIELLDSRRNQFFAPLALVLLWTTQIAFAIESWRGATGPAVSRWLNAIGELEGLCALANFSFEHPEDPFPEIVPDGPCFEGEGLGHPLLPVDRCVRNDLSLGKEPQLVLVSGSNMSGKSTLLRTVGTNAVLALAGGTVRARRLRISPLKLGSSIRIVDSLQGGSSRFYSEIKRLRRLLELTVGSRPLLFLLDEILHGTNSHDRRIGAEAVVHSFLNRGGFGLVTTHDLALAEIAGELAPRAANIHFEDHLEGGKIAFDYRIRAGVVMKSNALELMRSVGLEV